MEPRIGIGSTIVAVLLGAVMGAFAGGITSFTHRQWPLGPVPLGVPVGLLVIGSLLVGLRLAFQSRVVALAGALGVGIAVAVLAQRGPGGSVVIAQDPAGWLWVAGVLVVGVLAVLWPRSRGSARSRPERPSPTE